MINCININSLSLCNKSNYDEDVTKACYTETNPYNYNCFNYGCCSSCCPCSPVVPTDTIPTGPNPAESSAIFEAIRQRLNNNGVYINLIAVDIKGDAIKLGKVPGSILLEPNKTYKYSIETENTLEGRGLGSAYVDILLNSNRISGRSSAISDVQPGFPTMYKTNGEITTTGYYDESLHLIFKRNGGDPGVTSAKITITEVSK